MSGLVYYRNLTQFMPNFKISFQPIQFILRRFFFFNSSHWFELCYLLQTHRRRKLPVGRQEGHDNCKLNLIGVSAVASVPRHRFGVPSTLRCEGLCSITPSGGSRRSSGAESCATTACGTSWCSIRFRLVAGRTSDSQSTARQSQTDTVFFFVFFSFAAELLHLSLFILPECTIVTHVVRQQPCK